MAEGDSADRTIGTRPSVPCAALVQRPSTRARRSSGVGPRSRMSNSAESSSSGSDREDIVIQLLLAEYHTLRQESANAIVNRITIVSFTIGTLGLALGGLVGASRIGLTQGLLALFVAPWIPKTSLLIWMGEYRRSQRAGFQVGNLERRLNQFVRPGDRGAEGPLSWESARLGYGKSGILAHMDYPYTGTIVLLLGFGWAASVFGIATTWRHISGATRLAEVIYATVVELSALILLLLEKRNIK